MMSNRKFCLFLLSGTFFGMPALAMSAQDSANIHTHTNLLELKPASLEGSFKTASVCFLGVGDCDPNIGYGKGDDYEVNTENQCKNEGFTKQNCNSVQIIDGVCPYNSAYGNSCKCKPGLITCPAGQTGVGDACNGQYASCQCSPSLVSCTSNQNGSGAYCGGRYESCSCKSEYQYTSGNCTYPRSLSGATCSGMYTGCVCPSGVSAGSFGCAEYYPSPCSGVCKTAYADNCHARTAVSTPYGCATYWSDCTSKCQTAYNDNCRNRDAVYAPYGCQTYWGDCQSKCQIAKADPCDSVTAVTVPANASCTGSATTCPSKCTGWACNAGYNKSGDSCIEKMPASCEEIAREYYSVRQTPFLKWSCTQTTVRGLSCWECYPKTPGGGGSVDDRCPTDTVSYCTGQGYGHVYCKVGVTVSQTREYCSCNSGYWKCVGTAY